MNSSVVGGPSPDLISPAKKWQIGLGMQRKLREAVKLEDYGTAAQCRDALNSLALSPIQMLEMKMSEQLVDGTYDEKAKSLKKLSQLHPTEETQSLIIEAIKDEALTVRSAVQKKKQRDCCSCDNGPGRGRRQFAGCPAQVSWVLL